MLTETTSLNSPVKLDSFERELWSRLMPRLTPLVHVEREDIPAAGLFVPAVASYLRLTRTLQELKVSPTGSAVLDGDEVEREAARWCRTAREAAADFGLLPANRAGLALVDAVGEDIELKRIFGLEIKSIQTFRRFE